MKKENQHGATPWPPVVIYDQEAYWLNDYRMPHSYLSDQLNPAVHALIELYPDRKKELKVLAFQQWAKMRLIPGGAGTTDELRGFWDLVYINLNHGAKEETDAKLIPIMVGERRMPWPPNVYLVGEHDLTVRLAPGDIGYADRVFQLIGEYDLCVRLEPGCYDYCLDPKSILDSALQLIILCEGYGKELHAYAMEWLRSDDTRSTILTAFWEHVKENESPTPKAEPIPPHPNSEDESMTGELRAMATGAGVPFRSIAIHYDMNDFSKEIVDLNESKPSLVDGEYEDGIVHTQACENFRLGDEEAEAERISAELESMANAPEIPGDNRANTAWGPFETFDRTGWSMQQVYARKTLFELPEPGENT